jgi:hypothetical protein
MLLDSRPRKGEAEPSWGPVILHFIPLHFVPFHSVENPQLGVTRVRWAADSSLRFTPLRMTLQNQNDSGVLHPRLYTQEESKEIDQSLDIYTSL